MNKSIVNLSGYEIARQIKEDRISEEEVFSFFNNRIKQIDKQIKSFVDVYSTPVKEEGDSPLKGVPIAIKDNICIKGKRITCASRILNSHTCVYDATVVKRLKNSGLLIIGTTNMDEFAFGSSTENSCYGPTCNPWNTDCVPGGSSGGSAAAVAARLVPFALGSDTGGSIRQPASFCGVVGFKPTYGRISRFGLVAFGSSLDQIGPITTNFVDCAHLLNILCGFDEYDSTTSKQDVPDFTKSLVKNVKGLRIGLPREYFSRGLDQKVDKKVREVARKIGELANLSKTDLAVAALALDFKNRGLEPVIYTDDYSLQNLAKSLGITFHPIRTRGIARKRKYMVYCPACGYVASSENEKICPRCGHRLSRKPIS